MTTNNPMAVIVKAEIDIHTAIKAVQEFAEKYPIERLSKTQVIELEEAAAMIRARLVHQNLLGD
jgi:hypothetical protein